MDGVVVVGHEEVSPIPPCRIDERSNVAATRVGVASDAEQRPASAGYRQEPELGLNAVNLHGCGEPSTRPEITYGSPEMFRDQVHTRPMGSYEITWPTRLTHDPKKRLTTELASQEAAGSDAFARERHAETPVTSAHEPSNVRDLKSG
jgi:hypothetical protein